MDTTSDRIGGLYGALSYIVSQRHRDIGVRVALGASARAIGGLVMRQGMTPAIVGLGVSLLASVAIGRVIESMLFGISPAISRRTRLSLR